MSEARDRVPWVDQAKGIGIFLVVLGHTLRGLESSRIIHDSLGFRLVDSWIYRFHMPLFFLLSGLFAERRTGSQAGAFLWHKLATLMYPYLVWSTLQTLVQMAIGRHTNRAANPRDLAGILIEPIMQFWFLYALFLIALIYYGLRRCRLRPPWALMAFAAFWATQGWLPLGTWTPPYQARRHGIYYALGAVAGDRDWIVRIGRCPAPSLALTVALGYGIVTMSVLGYLGRPGLPTDLAVTLSGIAASVALAVLCDRTAVSGAVRVMGIYSLEIYVVHTIASAGIRIALQKALKVEGPAIHVALGTIGGIVLPLALARFSRRHRAEFLFRPPQG
jgi:uncharacterized membrane protein YcfT